MSDRPAVAVRFFVSGRVQGVFYRASTVEQARTLGLRGYARNLPDGRVEVLAAGNAAAIEQLACWLHEGPPLASVRAIERMVGDSDEATAPFDIRR